MSDTSKLHSLSSEFKSKQEITEIKQGRKCPSVNPSIGCQRRLYSKFFKIKIS